ncbi:MULTISPECIES: pyridoxamine kinase [Carnobacterium]|uniref:pyridoxal kinase n=1 Tax=Carnobacterium antarcticum TaxID=2126436 RepID=A0ABW4NKD0_9LACT|nr:MULTISPECIES: pyridoxamine kinase [unclassified Carnobacterium]ALV22008.1 Pyridoxal kinase [Carnobacterium sp. CP1]QQP69973.1 pyridoxamine kinase [Carnobacterium sp. CS13]
MKQPRILVIQDISASCRISMNVAVPILSCLGNWVNVLPTALLSTHTGKEFEKYTFLDLSAENLAILEHWRSLNIKFDGIVIGYLGTLQQIELMQKVIKEFTTEEALVVLDPVMGDEGQLYDGYTQQHVQAMRELCSYADVLIPNITEACLLTGRPYLTKPHQKGEVEELVKQLQQLTDKEIILSGVMLNEASVGAAIVSKTNAVKIQYTFAPVYPGHFDGTGDLFTSTVAGFLFQQQSLLRAAQVAVNYVSKVVEQTIQEGIDPLYGVVFEKELFYLMQQLREGTD